MNGEEPSPSTDTATETTLPDASAGPDEPTDGAVDAAMDAAAQDARDAADDPDTAAPGATDAQVADAGTPRGPRFTLPPATTARIETLVTPEDLPYSENGAFTEDGRFFVIGGSTLYEIVGGPETFRAEVLTEEPSCIYGGLTSRGSRLYALCTSLSTFGGQLFVYEPSRAEPLVSLEAIETESLCHFNGSAFGPDGALYVSNTQGTGGEDPAVVRLQIEEEEPLRLTQTPFIAAHSDDRAENTGGGSTPNGIRFAGDNMYYVRGEDLVRVPVSLDDPTAPLDVIYQPQGTLPVIDDFDIGDERLWLTQFETLRGLGLPGKSSLVVTDLDGEVELEMELPFVGSSAVVSDGTLFGPSILFTSFFDGGLYRLTFE